MLVSPLRDQPWNDRKADVEKQAEEPALIEAVLTPGDCLYLPADTCMLRRRSAS